PLSSFEPIEYGGMKPLAERILTTDIVSWKSVVPWACTMRRSVGLRILRMLFDGHDESCVQSAP
ncbi:MAG: hypothetical protein WA045_00555, partial [Nitrospira sp.]